MTPRTTSLAHCRLTESILREHVNHVGSGVGEIAARYADQQKKIHEMRDDISLRQLDTNKENKIDAVDFSIAIGNNGHEDDLVSNNGRTNDPSNQVPMETMNQCAESDCEVRKVCESITLHEERPGTFETMGDIPENVNESPVTSASQEEAVLSNRMTEATKKDTFKTASVQADTVLANEDKRKESASVVDFDTFARDETSVSSGDEFFRDGTSSCSLSLYNASEDVQHNDMIGRDKVLIYAGRGREQKKTLTAEYEDFEKRRQISKYRLLKENIINEAVMASRRCEVARRRWSNDSCSARLHAVPTQQQITSRRSLPTTLDTRTVLDTNMVEATEDKVAAAHLHESVNVLCRNNSELKIGATTKHLHPFTAKKRTVTSIDLSSSIKKRKMAVVADLFGETDSLFGCKIIEPPGTRKKKRCKKTSNKKNGRESNTSAIKSDYDEPKRVGKNLDVKPKSHSAIARGNRMRQSSANPASIERLYSFQRLHSFQGILFREGNDGENNHAAEGEGQSRRSDRARKQTMFCHQNVFEVGIRNVNDNYDDVASSDGTTAVRRKSSRFTACRGEKEYSADSIAVLQKSSGPTGCKGIWKKKRRDRCQQSPRCSSPNGHSSTATAGKEEMVAKINEPSDNDDTNVAVVGSLRHYQSYTVDIHENVDVADGISDDQSINTAGGAACFFESHNDEKSASVQPLHDIYFGLEDEHSTAEYSFSMLEYNLNESQIFHDVYFGRESVVENDDEEDYPRFPTHGVYFGLDDAHSLDESQLSMISLTEPRAEIPFHDLYFGQETYYEEVTGPLHNESETVRTRIPRCTIRSKPLFVMALLAAMLSRAL